MPAKQEEVIFGDFVGKKLLPSTYNRGRLAREEGI